LLVTSAGEGDGSPAVAAVLASLMARTGMSVMLIDADLERGPLAAIVDGKAASVASLGRALASKIGEPSTLTGTVVSVPRAAAFEHESPTTPNEDASVITSAVQPLVTSRLRALLDYPEDRHLTEWLPPARLSALVVHLKQEVDALVISAPPPPAAETMVLTDLADAIIITVAVGRTRRDQLTRLRERLAERGVVPAGFVVVERPSMWAWIARERVSA